MNGDLKGTGELKRKHVNTKIKQSINRKQLPCEKGPRDLVEVSRTQKFGRRAPQALNVICQ